MIMSKVRGVENAKAYSIIRKKTDKAVVLQRKIVKYLKPRKFQRSDLEGSLYSSPELETSSDGIFLSDYVQESEQYRNGLNDKLRITSD
ncbi:unnamed protein product [Bubo scandiacus]